MPLPTKLSKLAQIAVQALEDLKGLDIKVLDVQALTTVTDTMIMCTGTSNRHVKALAQNVAEDAKKAGYPPMGIEGQESGEWVLVDLGGVVVHVMQAQARVFYQLEKLWQVEDNLIDLKPKSSKPAKKAAAKTAAKTAAKKSPPKAVKKAAKKAVKKTAAGKVKGKAASKVSKPAPKKAAVRKAPAKKATARKPAAAKKTPARR